MSLDLKKIFTVRIDTGSLRHTVRGIGTYTQTLLHSLEGRHIPFSQNPLPLPFASSISALFRSKCFEKADLIHFPEPKILYGKRPNVPIVLTIHDVMPILFPHYFPKKSRIMMERFLPRFIRDADAITCPSHQTKEDLLKVFGCSPSKVHVIPLALLPKQRIIQEEKEDFLLYIGSFEPRKNLQGILSAYDKIRKAGFPHKLVLAGKEEGKNRLPKHLPSGVEVLGYVSEEKKLDLFKRAALLLWPSFYEGFGLPLLEAMASGTPIVTTQGSAMKEVVGDAALFANPSDPVEIAERTMEVLSSEEVGKMLMEKGLKRAKEFSMERFRNEHLLLYENLINHRGHREHREKREFLGLR